MIDFDRAVVVAIPVTAGFGEADARECMLLEGPQGWGEFSPPPDADDLAAGRWLTAAVEPGTVGWPDPVRGRVPVAVQIPAVAAAEAHRLVVDSGCATADVVVGSSVGGGSVDDDVARVAAVRDALGPSGRIRCDARGGWDVAAAVAAIPVLMDAAGELEYVTAPCRTSDELTAVRRQVDVRIAGTASDAVDVLVLTAAALGGVRRAMRVAEKSGLPCVVSAGRETSIGLAAAAALAGVLPELPFACAIGRPPWVAGDVVSAGRVMVAADGHLPVAPMPPAPDRGLLDRYAVTDATRLAWWRRRLQQAHY